MKKPIDFKGAKARYKGREWHVQLADGRIYRRTGKSEWQGYVIPTRDGGHSPHWRRPARGIVEQLEANYRRIDR